MIRIVDKLIAELYRTQSLDFFRLLKKFDEFPNYKLKSVFSDY